jgi:transcriptional regulator with XRE-family HTH domain
VIGNRLKEAREALGMTQEDLADKIGVQPLQINRYEHEKNKPSSEIILKMAEALSVSTDYLVGLTDDPMPVEFAAKALNARERAALIAWRRGQVVQAIKVIVGEE